MSAEEDKKYTEPTKLDEGKKVFLGVESVPGSLYTSGIICTKCHLCKNVGATEVESSWSVKSCLLCYYYGGYWACWQLIRGKDFIPKDAIHTCASCHKQIAHYKSCDVDVKEN